MYVPEAFAETDRDRQLDVIRATGWGYLVGLVGGRLEATHLPFLLDGEPGDEKLIVHMARANPHWESFAEGTEQLVVFPGPNAYVSPSWYAPGNAVPTWNYVAVHIYGVPRIVDDPAAVRRAQKKLVDHHESRLEEPWDMDDLPEDYLAGMLRAIVSFEIPIDRIEAKAKLSQNRSADDRARVVANLDASGNAMAMDVAKAMRDRET